FRAGGSWFDPHRPTRVLFEEEGSDLMHQDAGGTYRFSVDGQYYLQISGLFGQGCPDCVYQVQVLSREGASGWIARSEPTFSEWSERSFSRSLADNWMAHLEGRSVKAPEAKQVSSVQASGACRSSTIMPIPRSTSIMCSPKPFTALNAGESTPFRFAISRRAMETPAIITGFWCARRFRMWERFWCWPETVPTR